MASGEEALTESHKEPRKIKFHAPKNSFISQLAAPKIELSSYYNGNELCKELFLPKTINWYVRILLYIFLLFKVKYKFQFALWQILCQNNYVLLYYITNYIITRAEKYLCKLQDKLQVDCARKGKVVSVDRWLKVSEIVGNFPPW